MAGQVVGRGVVEITAVLAGDLQRVAQQAGQAAGASMASGFQAASKGVDRSAMQAARSVQSASKSTAAATREVVAANRDAAASSAAVTKASRDLQAAQSAQAKAAAAVAAAEDRLSKAVAQGGKSTVAAAAAAKNLDVANRAHVSSASAVAAAEGRLASAQAKSTVAADRAKSSQRDLQRVYGSLGVSAAEAAAATQAAAAASGSAFARISSSARSAGGGVRAFTAEVANVARVNRSAWDGVATSAGLAGAALAGGAAIAVKGFLDFDRTMSAVQAATDETGSSLDSLRALAVKAGADTQYSATEAAQGITEMAKAGVSTKDILNGGLVGALNLAAAGQMSVADSAELAATSMTQFGLSGSSVGRVADVLSAAAGKAQGSVADVGLALSYTGAQASSMGLSIEDTTALIYELAKSGLTGEKAGTGLRGMLSSLISPSTKASAEMAKLGINLYDATGKFVGAQKFTQILGETFGNMADEERNAALGAIFGAESIPAVTQVIKEAALGATDASHGFAAAKDAITDMGFASRQAAALTDNLAGDFERFRGSIETAFIQSGSGANDVLRGLTQTLTTLVNGFGALPGPLQQSLTLVSGFSGAGLLASAGLMKVVTTVQDLRENMRKTFTAPGGGLSGLGKFTAFVGGPLAIGLTAVTFALGKWAENSERAKAQTEALTNSLVDLIAADGGRVGQGAVKGITDSLQQQGVLDNAKRLGLNIADVAAASAGNAAAQDRVTKAIVGQYGALQQNTAAAQASGRGYAEAVAAQNQFGTSAASVQAAVNGSNTAVNAAVDAFKNQDQASKGAAAALGVAGSAAGDAGEKLTYAARGADGLVHSYDAGTIAARDMANAQTALNNELKNSPFLDARDGVAAYYQAVDEARKTLQGNKGAGLDLRSEKGRANNSALSSVTRAAKSVLQTNIGDPAGYAKALQEQTAQITALGKAAGLTKTQIAAWLQTNDLTAESARAMGVDVADLSGKTGGLSGAAAKAMAAVDKERVAIDGNRNSMGAAAGANLALQSATYGTKRAKDDLSAANKALGTAENAATTAALRNGATLDTHTKKGKANADMLAAVRQRGVDYIAMLVAQGAPEAKVQAALGHTKDALVQSAIKFGKTKTEAELYAAQLLDVPTAVATNVTTPGAEAAAKRIKDLQVAIDGMKSKSVDIKINGDGSVTRVTTSQDGTVRSNLMRAQGGIIPGPASTSDTVPAWLSTGEFVVKASETSKHRGLLEAINSGRMAGFARGGVVGPQVKTNITTPGVDPAAVTRNFNRIVDAYGAMAQKQAQAAMTATPVGGPPGAGVKRWTSVVLQALAMMGQPASLLNVVLRRMNQESGGNPNIVNNWDSNAKKGTPSGGLMQCVTMDTKILTKRGWLTYEEVEVGDFTIGYNPAAERSEWTPVTKKVKYENGQVWRVGNKGWSAKVTPNHRWWSDTLVFTTPEDLTKCPECGWEGRTDARAIRDGIKATPRSISTHRGRAHGINAGEKREARKVKSFRGEFIRTEDFTYNHRVRLAAPADTDGIPGLSLEDCRIIAWLQGDGTVSEAYGEQGGRHCADCDKAFKTLAGLNAHLSLKHGVKAAPRTKSEFFGYDGTIWQSKPAMVTKIRALLATVEHTEAVRQRGEAHHLPAHAFRLRRAFVTDLFKRAPGALDNPEAFVLALSPDQRAAWLDSMIDAEGHRQQGKKENWNEFVRIAQIDGPLQDAIRLAVFLEGYRPTYSANSAERNGYQPAGLVGMAGPHVVPSMFGEHEVLEDQDVWCVKTDLETWTAEQDGQVFITGNTIGPTFRAYHFPGTSNNMFDPLANILASMRYALARYGSLSAAYNKRGGYDEGGIARGKGLMAKNTIAPERVLSPQQTAAFDRLVDSLSKQGGVNGVRTAVTVGVDTSAFRGAGVQAGSGFSSGILSMRRPIDAAAAGLASTSLDAARRELGIASPSKAFLQVGKDSGAGFVQGLRGSREDLQTAMNTLINDLFRNSNPKLAKATLALRGTLLSMFDKRAGLQQRVADQKAAMTDLVKSMEDFKTQLRDSLVTNGSVTGQDSFTFRGITDGMRKAVDDARGLNSVITRLKSAGLNQTSLGQIVAGGTDSGLRTANLILSQRDGVKQVNALQAQLGKAAGDAASNAAGGMYGAGVQAGWGLLKGLQSQEKALSDQMVRMGASLVASIRKALGIKSPSRVFAAVGEQTVAGFIAGVDRRHGDAQSALAAMASVVPVQRQVGREALVSSLGRLRTSDAAPGAPVVAQGVTINGDVHTQDPDEFARLVSRRQRDMIATLGIAQIAAGG